MSKNATKRLLGVVLGSFSIGIIIGSLVINQVPIVPENSDYAHFWLGGRITREELNPYDQALWQAETAKLGGTYDLYYAYIYPLPLAVLFAPLTLLSLKNSFILWIALSITGLTTIGFVFFEGTKHEKKWPFFPLYLTGVFLLRGTLANIVGGHMGIIWVFFFLLGIILARREKWFWAGFALAFPVLKPTIAGTALLLIAIWLLINRNWKAVLGGASGGLTLFLMGVLKNPLWAQEFLAQGQEVGSTYYQITPSFWGLSSRLCGLQSPCTEIMAGSLSLVAFGFGVWLILKHPYRHRAGFIISVSITISLMVTPYLWAHDHMLLIVPFIYLLTTLIEKEISFLYTGIAILAFVLFAFGMLFVAMPTQQDQWSVLVPTAMLGIILLSFRKSKQIDYISV